MHPDQHPPRAASPSSALSSPPPPGLIPSVPYLPSASPPHPFPTRLHGHTTGSRSPFDAGTSDGLQPPASAPPPQGHSQPLLPPPRDPFKPAPFTPGSRQTPNYGSMAEDEKLLSRASCFLFYFIFFLPLFQGSFSLPPHEVKELKTNSETDNRVTVPHKKAAEALEKAGIRCIRDFCRGSWE